MNRFNDFHDQISDISSIPANSHSSSRLIGRVDLSHSFLESHSSAIKNSTRTAISQETSIIEKTISSLVLCEKNISEHIKANIVYQCIKKASLNDKDILSKSTVSKLQTLLLLHKLDKYMHLSSSNHMQDKLVLLGIVNLPSCDLNADEKLEIKCCIETILREMIHDMIIKYEALGGNTSEVAKNSEIKMQNKFLEYCNIPAVQWKNKIDDLILQYESDLLKYINLIEKWNKLKYEIMSRTYLEKTGYLLLQAQVAELQAKITKLSCTIRMFRETSTTIDAFKILNQSVEEKLKIVTNEIRQKEDLKKLYDNLKNTEYDQVLITYSQFCNAIKKKKYILDQIK
ncbi:hypothetical protein PUN28_014405 [Cardiocondyla obscurior]